MEKQALKDLFNHTSLSVTEQYIESMPEDRVTVLEAKVASLQAEIDQIKAQMKAIALETVIDAFGKA